MSAWAIYQWKDGSYCVRRDRGESLVMRRVCAVGSNEGGLAIAMDWNRTAEMAAAIRKSQLKDEPVVVTGKDAPNEAEEPTDTTPCSTSRLSLVSIQEGAR